MHHDDGAFRDWGVSGSLGYRAEADSKRGLSLKLTQEQGGSASGGVDGLFAAGAPAAANDNAAGARWTMEAGYGLPAFGGRFTGTPHLGYGWSDTARDYTLGWRLAPEGPAAPDLSFDLKATRRESGGAQPDHGVRGTLTVRW